MKNIMKYQQWMKWIKDNVPADPEQILSRCKEFVDKMHAQFPELTPVAGHVMLSNGWTREHWWLTDGANVIDPTSNQFKGKYFGKASILYYEPWEGPLPTGKCPNCGDYCFNGESVCSESCGNSYTAYLNAELRR